MKQSAWILGVLCMQQMAVASWCGSGQANIPDDGVSTRVWLAQADEPVGNLVVQTRLYVSLEHPWIGDLSIDLVAPDGTSISMLDRPGMPNGGWIGAWGCGGDDIVCMLDDAGGAADYRRCPS